MASNWLHLSGYEDGAGPFWRYGIPAAGRALAGVAVRSAFLGTLTIT